MIELSMYMKLACCNTLHNCIITTILACKDSDLVTSFMQNLLGVLNYYYVQEVEGRSYLVCMEQVFDLSGCIGAATTMSHWNVT